jgi:hypothetical protein
MTAQAIAEALGINVRKVNAYLDSIRRLSEITTPEEAEDLHRACPDEMKPAVVAKWTELVLPTITTPEEAQALFQTCPETVEPLIVEWMSRQPV